MKKTYSFVAFLSGIILFLSLVQIVISNRLSTTGVTLGKLHDEIAFYKTENTILAEKLLVATSLNRIASSAAEIGFAEAKTPIVFSEGLPIAKRP